MTVSEFIKLWDSINDSYIPIEYTYLGTSITKIELYDINTELISLNIECVPMELQKYHINIEHSRLDYTQFNYDQQKFYNELSAEVPPNTYTNIIRMNIN